MRKETSLNSTRTRRKCLYNRNVFFHQIANCVFSHIAVADSGACCRPFYPQLNVIGCSMADFVQLYQPLHLRCIYGFKS